ncbi:Retrotransposon-derived protein [Salix suchowensis]|nr:Retrotransposon-derived protein [Salix suchowensis]
MRRWTTTHLLNQVAAQLGNVANAIPPLAPPPPQFPAAPLAPQLADIPCSTAKFKEPRIFTGKASNVPGFIAEVSDGVELQRAQLPTDKDKCFYMGTYLGNGPQSCGMHPLKLTNHIFYRTSPHSARLSRATSVTKISLEQLIARFKPCAKQTWLERLKDDIKDILVNNLNPPIGFKDYIDLAMKIDNRICQCKFSASVKINLAGNRHHQNPTPSSSMLPPGEPMEIDATHTSRPVDHLRLKNANVVRTLVFVSIAVVPNTTNSTA